MIRDFHGFFLRSAKQLAQYTWKISESFFTFTSSWSFRYDSKAERVGITFTLGEESLPKVLPSDCLRVSVLAEACEHSWRTGSIVTVQEFTEKMLKKENIESKNFLSAL